VSTPIEVIDVLAAKRVDDAAVLIIEYMAATLTEAGRPTSAEITSLPPVLQYECRNLATVYRPPGALLVAYEDQQPVGCVGLALRSSAHTAEVKRLYVRPGHRGGTGRLLMNHAHLHAAHHGITHLVLDVLPSRQRVIDFYRRLGYTDSEPFANESPTPMVYMQRSAASAPLEPSDAEVRDSHVLDAS
jgi:ribosomal protein S18 acetylase RimI-like enzyme